jgi:hypothetical protein
MLDGCDVIEVAEEVSGGCVCCTVRRDIEDVLADEALSGVPSFDLVVIDTASESDPMPVIATLFEEHANEVVTPEVSQCFHLDAVVCVVDGRHPDALGRDVHEARQLAFADVIVVTNSQHRNVKSSGGPAAAAAALTVALATAQASLDERSRSRKEPSTGALPRSVTLTKARPATNGNWVLSATTAATTPTILLPESTRERICAINPLAQITELPRLYPGRDGDSFEARAQPGHVPFAPGHVMDQLVGFNTYCASAFDRLDLSELRFLRSPPAPSLSGVTTTVVFAEGRLMQRRFRRSSACAKRTSSGCGASCATPRPTTPAGSSMRCTPW